MIEEYPAPMYYNDAPAAPAAGTEAPAEAAPVTEAVYYDTTVAPTEEVADTEIIADIPLTEEISYTEPAPPVEMPGGGYKKRFRVRKVKRTFALKRATESDIALRFQKNCADRNPRCDFWASLTAVRKDGRVVRVDECRSNPMMRTMEGCPRACDVCTPNLVEWKLRRRNAMVLRRRRLAKKKNL
jgi:hypothetical protein